MKLDKKQVPQLIVLGVLVIICIGYVSFTIAKPPQGQPAAPGQKAAVNNNVTSTEGEQTSEESSSTSIPSNVFPDATVALPRRDPFATQALSSEVAAETSQKVAVNPVKLKPAKAYKPIANSGSVPKIDLKTFNPFTQQQNVQVAPVPELYQAPPQPQYTLTGVIRGNKNVAIIKSDSGGRHVVREGQMIDGRYKVQSVSDDGVVLVNQGRRIYVKLGGVKNAS